MPIRPNINLPNQAAAEKVPCPNCGKLIKKGAPFCGFCGTKIEPVKPPVPVSQQAVQPPVNVPESPFDQAENETVFTEQTVEAPASIPVVPTVSSSPFEEQPFPSEPFPQESSPFENSNPFDEPEVQPFPGEVETVSVETGSPFEESSTPFQSAAASPFEQSAPVFESSEPQPAFSEAAVPFPTKKEIQVETELELIEVSPFAKGLPDWDVLPPHIMVRKKKR